MKNRDFLYPHEKCLCVPTTNPPLSLNFTKNLRSRLYSVRTSRETDFWKLKITLVTMTYHSQHPLCPLMFSWANQKSHIRWCTYCGRNSFTVTSNRKPGSVWSKIWLQQPKMDFRAISSKVAHYQEQGWLITFISSSDRSQYQPFLVDFDSPVRTEDFELFQESGGKKIKCSRSPVLYLRQVPFHFDITELRTFALAFLFLRHSWKTNNQAFTLTEVCSGPYKISLVNRQDESVRSGWLAWMSASVSGWTSILKVGHDKSWSIVT